MRIKELFRELEAAEERSAIIDKKWDEEPENEEIEAEWDKAMKEEHKIFVSLIEEIVLITNGIIDKKTAYVMVRTKRETLRKIMEKIA